MPSHADILKAMEIPDIAPGEHSEEGSIDLIDDELEEDDEIQDDLHIPAVAVSVAVAVEESAPVRRAKEEIKEHSSNLSPRKLPPTGRAEKSPSGGRRTKQRSGSMRGIRSRGRKPVKDWGHASSPAISIKDIMGGERKATHVGLVEASPGKDTVKAETKLVNIKRMKGAKKERRRDVKNSLAHFLHANQPEESDYEEEEEEDESLISEEEDAPCNETIISDREKSDGDRSIKSQKSHSRRRRRVRRPAATEEGASGSTHSRKRGVRRRGKGDGDDGTVGSVGRRERSRRSTRRSSGVDGDPPQRRRRPAGDSRSLDGSELQRRRPLGDSASVDGSTMNRRRRGGDDADDRSVGSRRSVGRRRRLKSDARPTRKKSNMSENGRKNNKEPNPPEPRQSIGSVDMPDGLVLEPEEKPSSIPKRISVVKDSEEDIDGSDSSSNLGLIDQPALIQFDPTNENHFTLVSQSNGHITSEKIRHADGTECELHITELEGLPTFEVPAIFHDSVASGLSDAPFPPVSGTGADIVEVEGEVNDTLDKEADDEQPGAVPPNLSEQSQVEEGGSGRKIKRNKSGGLLRGSSSTTSFFQRMRGQKPEGENGEGQKSFFSGWKKKDKDGSDEEEDTGGFFKKFEAKTHQALEDDGSYHD